MSSEKQTIVGLNIQIFSSDIDGLSDLMEYVGDNFSNSIVRWM